LRGSERSVTGFQSGILRTCENKGGFAFGSREMKEVFDERLITSTGSETSAQAPAEKALAQAFL